MKKAFLFAGLLFASAVAQASGGSGSRTISSIQVEGNSYVIVLPTTPWENPDGCQDASRAMVPMTDPAYEAKLSVALAAYMGGKKLGFWLVGCQQSSQGTTIPVIHTMSIVD